MKRVNMVLNLRAGKQIHPRLGTLGYKTDFDFQTNVVGVVSALTRFMLKQ